MSAFTNAGDSQECQSLCSSLPNFSHDKWQRERVFGRCRPVAQLEFKPSSLGLSAAAAAARRAKRSHWQRLSQHWATKFICGKNKHLESVCLWHASPKWCFFSEIGKEKKDVCSEETARFLRRLSSWCVNTSVCLGLIVQSILVDGGDFQPVGETALWDETLPSCWEHLRQNTAAW